MSGRSEEWDMRVGWVGRVMECLLALVSVLFCELWVGEREEMQSVPNSGESRVASAFLLQSVTRLARDLWWLHNTGLPPARHREQEESRRQHGGSPARVRVASRCFSLSAFFQTDGHFDLPSAARRRPLWSSSVVEKEARRPRTPLFSPPLSPSCLPPLFPPCYLSPNGHHRPSFLCLTLPP